MNEKLTKKSNSLKQAIEKYNMYKRFVDTYKNTNSLDEYITHVRLTTANAGDSLIKHYESLINSYNRGNVEPLLSNLYERLLAADENKNKIADELKAMLRE